MANYTVVQTNDRLDSLITETTIKAVAHTLKHAAMRVSISRFHDASGKGIGDSAGKLTLKALARVETFDDASIDF